MLEAIRVPADSVIGQHGAPAAAQQTRELPERRGGHGRLDCAFHKDNDAKEPKEQGAVRPLPALAITCKLLLVHQLLVSFEDRRSLTGRQRSIRLLAKFT